MLISFQLAVVRLLPVGGYVSYALVIAWSGLLQTVTSAGLPRVASRFLSLTGTALSESDARRLMRLMLVGRFALIVAVITVAAAGCVAWAWSGRSTVDWPLAWSGTVYALFSTLQSDIDGMALALGLQGASRFGAISEPMARLTGVAALALLGRSDILELLWVSAATSGGDPALAS